MNANELADQLEQAATMLRQQQNKIEDLINAHRFVQNFAEEQHQRAVALESELDRAVELYTDKAIENEALKKSHIELERGIVKDLNQRQRNEPVAWLINGKLFEEYFRTSELDVIIPLYTHPVKEQDTDCQYCKQGCIRCDARKQLTDAEIRTIQDMCHLKNVGYNTFIMRFARAILRKAQEK